VAEALRALQQIEQDQRLPFPADHLQRCFHGAAKLFLEHNDFSQYDFSDYTNFLCVPCGGPTK
jgi:hypothetical protein